MSKILLKNVDYLTMTQPTVEHGDILIDGTQIRALGEVPMDLLAGGDVEIIDGSHTLAMPGLVNTHNHAAMTLLRSYADDMELMPWLTERIWPAEAKMSDEHIYWGSLLAMAEMIASGTTTFADMYSSMDHVAQAAAEIGIRADLSRGCIKDTDHDYNSIRENKDLFDKWHGQADGRIHVRFGPHAPYTCPPDYMTKIVETAQDCQAGLHVHVAETQDELRQIREGYGKTPVEYLNDLGVFERPTLAAHCVHLTEQDMDILAQRGVSVAHCPVSNMKLASGTAPVPQLLAKHITVGLGTDGASSNNSMNLMRDLSVCSFLHKLNSMDPTALDAYDILRMATIGGAKALGWDQEIGTLEIGKKADVILIDLEALHYYPHNNIISDMVYSSQGADVKTTIINGQIIMRDRRFTKLDLDKVKAEMSQAARAITRN